MELFDFRLVAGSPLGIEILTRVVTIFLIRYTRSEDIKSRNLLKAEICSCVPWTVTLSTLYCFFFFFLRINEARTGRFLTRSRNLKSRPRRNQGGWHLGGRCTPWRNLIAWRKSTQFAASVTTSGRSNSTMDGGVRTCNRFTWLGSNARLF